MKNKSNILFISCDFNYFINNNGSFYRMYQNLIFFHEHKDYNVIVLQNNREIKYENQDLKNGIKCYYFRPLQLLNNHFIHFLDINPFFITKVIKIINKHQISMIHFDYPYGINGLKYISKIPISYNAYNVEYVFYKQLGYLHHKIPPFLRSIYTKFIYMIEKNAIKLAKNVNAFSVNDKIEFEKIYKIPKGKVFINDMGYKKEIFNNPLKQDIARDKLKIDKTKFVVIFHGYYFYNDANKRAIDLIKNKIVPRVNDEEILFIMAGKMPRFKELKNLKILGYVDDLRYFLYAADIAIVPITRGSGIRIKMIDYLSSRIPIITTKTGALGLSFNNNEHGYIINETNMVEEIIEKIIFLKNNPSIIRLFKENIESMLKKEYNWESILKRLEKRYQEIILMR